jgi:hypothetical protein
MPHLLVEPILETYVLKIREFHALQGTKQAYYFCFGSQLEQTCPKHGCCSGGQHMHVSPLKREIMIPSRF